MRTIWPVGLSIDWLIDRSMDWLIDRWIDWLIDWVILSFLPFLSRDLDFKIRTNWLFLSPGQWHGIVNSQILVEWLEIVHRKERCRGGSRKKSRIKKDEKKGKIQERKGLFAAYVGELRKLFHENSVKFQILPHFLSFCSTSGHCLDSSDEEAESDEYQLPAPEEMPLTGFMVYGPPGVGKTAAMHALAKELGFTVLEINPASCKDAKQILIQSLEATQSHRVHGAPSTTAAQFLSQPRMDLYILSVNKY